MGAEESPKKSIASDVTVDEVITDQITKDESPTRGMKRHFSTSVMSPGNVNDSNMLRTYSVMSNARKVIIYYYFVAKLSRVGIKVYIKNCIR